MLWDEQTPLPFVVVGARQGKRWRGLRDLPVSTLIVIVGLQSAKRSKCKKWSKCEEDELEQYLKV